MKKLLLTIIIAVFGLQYSQAQIPPVFANHLQYLLDSACQKNKIKGVSAAVLIPGMGVWKGTYGVSHDNVALTTDMWLPIGSNTKTFTAAIMLQLQQEGKLSLDDTIGKWFTNVPNVNGQITIRQMLNHTSGLYNYTNSTSFSAALNADYTKVWVPEDLLQFIEAPQFAPGTGWSYCNTGYLLSGLIIKQVLNEPFHTTVRNRILNARSYNKSCTFPQEQPTATVPHGWSVAASGGAKLEDIQVNYSWENTAFLSMATAAGAIVSTAEDNVHFWDDMMTGKIVNPASMSELMNAVTMSSNSKYGLGIMRYGNVNGRVGYCHGGTCFGYINENFRDSLSGICITLLSNQDSIGNSLLFSRVLVPLHRYLIKVPTASIAGMDKGQGICIYPNPASNDVNIKMEDVNSNTIISVYDMAGKNLVNVPAHTGINTLSVATLQHGLYILRITADGAVIHTGKLQVAN